MQVHLVPESRLGLGVPSAWQCAAACTSMTERRDADLLTARAASRAAMRRFASDGGSGWCRSPSLIFSMASRTIGMSICAWLRRTYGSMGMPFLATDMSAPAGGPAPLRPLIIACIARATPQSTFTSQS